MTQKFKIANNTRMLRTMLVSRWSEQRWWLFSVMVSSHSSSLGGGRRHRPATSVSDSESLEPSPVRAILRHISVTDGNTKYSFSDIISNQQQQPTTVIERIYASTRVSLHLQLRNVFRRILLVQSLTARGNQRVWIREKMLEFSSRYYLHCPRTLHYRRHN